MPPEIYIQRHERYADMLIYANRIVLYMFTLLTLLLVLPLYCAVLSCLLCQDADIVWEECARNIRYKQSDGSTSMVPIYQFLIDGDYGLNILVYSGDDDSVW